jgi:hypothetical protein
VPRPRPDRVASDRASARAASKKSKASAKAASVPASRKKSALPTILGLLGGAAVIGGVAWWLLSKKAQAAEGGGARLQSHGGYTLEKPFVLPGRMSEIIQAAPMQRLRRAGIFLSPLER